MREPAAPNINRELSREKRYVCSKAHDLIANLDSRFSFDIEHETALTRRDCDLDGFRRMA